MKKILVLALAALLLLVSCGSADTAAVSHETTMFYCRFGDTLYFHTYYNAILNGNFDREVPLCRDPLCKHRAYDEMTRQWYSLCPASLAKSFPSTVTYTTDGVSMFMACKAENVEMDDGMTRAIYRFDPNEPTNLSRIAVYSTTGTLFAAPIFEDDGVIYFPQGFYRDDYKEGQSESLDDQYQMIMQVDAKGGKITPAIDEEFRVEYKFYMDDNYFYIINYDGPLTLIHRETGEKSEIMPDNYPISQVYSHDGAAYLIANEEARTVTFETDNPVSTGRVYRYENGTCTLLCENVMNPQIMDGALWYTPYEATCYGSRTDFNGRENEMRDFVSFLAPQLCRMELSTGEIVTWEQENPDLDLWFVGCSAGTVIVRPGDVKAEFEGGKRWLSPMYWKAVPGEDGILRLTSAIEEGSE